MKPSIPQGTRDFSAEVVRKRQFIFDTIRSVFELYGFQPLETPAMENLETLTGKYGDEGDKLIFKVLNNGISDPKNTEKSKAAFENILRGKSDRNLTERALKYDLTIPFARYVAMNHGQLTFPFKRYQIQPVWRADRPQKGRYREFYQCDADVVGSRSLLNEVEFAMIYREVFEKLGIEGCEIKINSRKILQALAAACGGQEQMMEITIAIDKLDKIGMDAVMQELAGKGLDATQQDLVKRYLQIGGSNAEKLAAIEALLGQAPGAQEGKEELSFLLQWVTENERQAPLVVDFTLARGLNYYTGIIFEVKAPATVKIGSIGGGGRYDDLTGLFGVPGIPGAGISFGVDRIYDVMEELGAFPKTLEGGSRILFFNMGPETSRYVLPLLQRIRQSGIPAEIFHEAAKFDKQFKYAEKKGIGFVVIIGSNEMETGRCIVKNIRNGQQEEVASAELDSYFSKLQASGLL